MEAKGTPRGSRARRALGSIVGVALVMSIMWAGPAGQSLVQASAKHHAATSAPGREPLVVVPAKQHAPDRGPVGKPNIVLILTDDQRWDTLEWMPNVRHLLVDHGVTFANAFVPNDLCCPSRTTILTGEYSHTTGVWSNEWPYGGFKVFYNRGEERSTIATWLQSVGYHTALIGKYLNDYGGMAHQHYVPPGWEHWVSFAENNGAHFDYDLTIDGVIHHFGTTRADFSTDVFTNHAVDWIHSTKGPLFMYYAPFAPHEPYDAPASDACPKLGPYTSPSYGEADVSDKPLYVRQATWNNADQHRASWIRAGQCGLLTGADRGVGRIVKALADTGRLSNTMIMFMSDNGYMWGEHREFYKAKPYSEALRVPMVVRYDPLTKSPRTDDHIVLNLDVAQTFADLAGAPSPGAEGRSMLPLIAGRQVPWRQDFLLEHSYGTEADTYRAPDYCGLRSKDWSYTMYMFGAQELYDLRSDPNEMANIAGLPSAQAQVKAMRDEVVRRCNPLPPRFPKL